MLALSLSLTRATFYVELNGKQNKGNAHILQTDIILENETY